ncbi:MAG TPA: MFS transporter [Chloroflexota bacterium]
MRQTRFSRMVSGSGHKWWVLAVVDIGILMATLDASIVNIALPTILSSFKTTLVAAEWVLEAYLLTITSLLLPFGRLSDILGRKRVYTAGFTVFTVGSLLCGFSQNVEELIAFRVLQAAGAAMIMANGFAIVTAVFPPKQRGMALGINGTMVATGFTLGPTIGGLLIATLGWRWIFFVNIPIGVVGTLAGIAVLKEALVTGHADGVRPRFDFAGAALSTVALLSLLLALNIGPESGWTSAPTLAASALFVVLGALWVVVESRVKDPMVNLSIFRRRTFSAGNLAGLLAFLAISANAFLMPFFLQLVLGYSAIQAGLLMTPTALVMAVIAPISGWLSDRLGARLLSSAGLALNGIALFFLGTLSAGTHYTEVLRWLVLLGIGQGLFQSPNNSSVMGDVPRSQLGVGSGLLAMVRNVGQVVGIAVSASFLLSGLSEVAGRGEIGALASVTPGAMDPAFLSAFMHGLHASYWAAAGFAAVGVASSLVRGKQKAHASA